MNQPLHVQPYVCLRTIVYKAVVFPFLTLFITLISINAKAQSMGISSSSITPDASSILELRTTSKGFLIPRMTQTQRDAIISPATGLMIYNTSTNTFNFYNGTGWTALTSGTAGTVSSVTSADANATVATTTTTPVITIVSAPKLQTARTINGVSFDGTANITVPSGNLTGDVTSSGNATTLATVNSNLGTWNNVTVNARGLVTAGSNTTYTTPSDNLSVFSATTSAQLAGVLSDETGTGSAVFSASPTFTGTPTLPSGTIATTQAFGDASTKIATTAFVDAETPMYAKVTGSNATTTGTSLTNITGLSITLAANTVYEFFANLSVASNSTAGTKYGVNYSTTGATVEANYVGTSTATASVAGRISALNTATGVLMAVAADGTVHISGVITTGANTGNLTIQHLKFTSGTSTVYTNSFLKVIKIQ